MDDDKIDFDKIVSDNMQKLEHNLSIKQQREKEYQIRKKIYRTKTIPYLKNKRGGEYVSFQPKTIMDRINYTQFPAVFTATYTHIPDEYMKGMQPIYTAGKLDGDEYGVLTVMGMLDLMNQGSSFRLCHIEDVYTAYNLITEWLEYLDLTARDDEGLDRKMHTRSMRELQTLIKDILLRHEQATHYKDAKLSSPIIDYIRPTI